MSKHFVEQRSFAQQRLHYCVCCIYVADVWGWANSESALYCVGGFKSLAMHHILKSHCVSSVFVLWLQYTSKKSKSQKASNFWWSTCKCCCYFFPVNSIILLSFFFCSYTDISISIFLKCDEHVVQQLLIYILRRHWATLAFIRSCACVNLRLLRYFTNSKEKDSLFCICYVLSC